MKIGSKVKIKTKKGVVEKYLSFYDQKTKTYYFVEKEKDINSSSIGYMFGVRGTAHSFKNIVWE